MMTGRGLTDRRFEERVKEGLRCLSSSGDFRERLLEFRRSNRLTRVDFMLIGRYDWLFGRGR